MNAHQFQVGEFECYALQTSAGSFDANTLFASLPDDQRAAILHDNGVDPDNIGSSHTCLLIHSGEEWVLVDAGLGTAVPDRKTYLYDLLDDIGVGCDGITCAVITHGHFDHFCGMTDGEGNLMFRNARHIMARDEWAYWTSDEFLSQQTEERANDYRQYLNPLGQHLDLINDNDAIMPGISLVPLPGHTPHHVGVSVNDALLFVVDAALHPLHLEYLDWYPMDMDPTQACRTRRAIAERAVSSGALIMAYHFEFPGLGHVVKSGEGYRWQPQP